MTSESENVYDVKENESYAKENRHENMSDHVKVKSLYNASLTLTQSQLK
jgi:hypothetical protein